jgi:very-short-patch-repair endonuclease
MPDVVRFEHHSDALFAPGDRAVAALAARQHGVVAYRQLLELGLGKGAIQRRVLTGRLHPIHVGVYAVGHSAITGHGRWMAAVLACGRRATLSHQSAGALWELHPTSRTVVDVIVPRRGRRSRPGISVHEVRRLHPDDRTRRRGIPVTTVARTLLDLAEVLRPPQIERAVETAERLDVLDMTAIEELCGRSRGRRGLRPLGRVLGEYRDPGPTTRSELERHFLEICRDALLPIPAVNVVVAGFEVDAVWPDQRLVVELDGRAFHHTTAAFERDRIRDAELQVAGYRVVRVTHRRLRTEPAAVTQMLRSMLAVG